MSKDFSNLLGGALANKQADEAQIRNRIVIREELKELIPPLHPDEISQLEANILAEGVRDPLIIWPVGDEFILVDGHNRYSICKKHNLNFPFKQVAFKDEEEVRDWMIRNQLGRRNLSIEQQSYLRGLRYNREKSQGKRNDLTLDQNDPKSESTATMLAREYGVSEATIKRDGEFAAGVDEIGSADPQLKKQILEGKSKLSKQEVRAKAKKEKAPGARVASPVAKLSAGEVGEIALQYIREETRTFEEVCSDLGLDASGVKPNDFFSRWRDLTQK